MIMGSKCLYLIFIIWCTLLISNCWTHSHHDHDHNEDHHHTHESPSFKYSREANEKPRQVRHTHEETKPTIHKDDVWIHALGSTLFISVAPVVILLLVPLDNTEKHQPLLKILLAFASGGLLGDAFLHLIPHASMSVNNDSGHGHTHQHHHDHHEEDEDHSHDMWVGLWVLFGILTFLVIEKGVRLIKGGHGHSHSHVASDNKKSEKSNADASGDNAKESKAGDSKEVMSQPSGIKVAGWLNLAADFSHNFTDGLAIGVSYLAGDSIGLATTISILLHEVPHEIGDFAILLQSGVSRRKAMLFQLVTALGALAGTALSLCGYGLLGASWILPFTAGGFIYIALVSVIPELLEEEKPSLFQTLLQVLAMSGGVYMMVLMAELE